VESKSAFTMANIVSIEKIRFPFVALENFKTKKELNERMLSAVSRA
jgi:hypothetical protein